MADLKPKPWKFELNDEELSMAQVGVETQLKVIERAMRNTKDKDVKAAYERIAAKWTAFL